LDKVILNNRSRILSLFPELAEYGPEDYARIGTPRPVLMVAMTARTGSTLLMGGLSQALNLGNPADMTEIFNSREILPWYKNNRNLQSFAQILQSYYSRSASHIVFKTNWQDFAFFKDHIGVMFPNLKMLYLDRISIEAQAVSVVKAMESNVWHTASDTEIQNQRDKAEDIESKFDLVRICRTIGTIAAEKANWERLFFDSGREPVRLIYEGFSEDLQMGINRVATAIGIDASTLPRVRPYFKKLSDSVNDNWVKKVKDYRSGAFYRRTIAARQDLNANRGGQGKDWGL
jgi:LPS sulfotransferase NodH